MIVSTICSKRYCLNRTIVIILLLMQSTSKDVHVHAPPRYQQVTLGTSDNDDKLTIEYFIKANIIFHQLFDKANSNGEEKRRQGDIRWSARKKLKKVLNEEKKACFVSGVR